MKHAIIIFLLITSPVYAQDWYCDAAAGGGGNGTTGTPWNWAEATDNGNVSAGETVACRGDFGDIVLATTNAKGSVGGGLVIYTSWTTDPTFDTLDFSSDGGSGWDAYIVFDDWVSDAGNQPSGLNLVDVQYVNRFWLLNSVLIGAAVDFMSGGTYAPYAYDGDAIFFDGDATDGGGAQFITIDGCTITGGYNGVRCARNGSNWTINNSEFSGVNDNSVQFAGGNGDNSVVSNCEIHNLSSESGIVWWDGSATGDWSGREGEAIIQDTTNATATFWEFRDTGTDLYMFPDGAGPIPRRNNDFTWRLVSDPDNIFFEVTGGGGNSDDVHSDGFSAEGNCDGLLVDSCLFYDGGITYQLLKINDNGITATVQNCVFFSEIPASVLVLNEKADEVNYYNNTIIAFASRENGAIRFQQGAGGDADYNVHNNVITGGIYSSGDMICSNNIWAVTQGELNDNLEGAGSTYNADLTNSGSPRLFTNYAENFSTFDFSIFNISSTQVDAASATFAPADDFNGDSRPNGSADDIGAYEFDQGGVTPKYLIGR